MLPPIVEAPETEMLATPPTAELKAAAPVMVYPPMPEILALFVVVAAVLFTAPRASVPPTIPLKLTAPEPAFNVSALADVVLFKVLLKVILLLVVESVVNADPRVIAFPKA